MCYPQDWGFKSLIMTKTFKQYYILKTTWIYLIEIAADQGYLETVAQWQTKNNAILDIHEWIEIFFKDYTG